MKIYWISLPFLLFGCDPAHNPSSNTIKGKWTNVTKEAGKVYEFVANFKEDGSYDGILNGKVLVSGGTYEQKGDTIVFKDPVCNATYPGSYKLHFKGDSVRFELLSDSCTLRKQGTDGVGMKRS